MELQPENEILLSSTAMISPSSATAVTFKVSAAFPERQTGMVASAFILAGIPAKSGLSVSSFYNGSLSVHQMLRIEMRAP